MNRKPTVVALLIVLLTGVVCRQLFWGRVGNLYEARCVIVQTDDAIVTNEVGEVVQPKGALGTYRDNRVAFCSEFEAFRGERGSTCALLQAYLSANEGGGLDALDISNAFESVRYVASEDPISIVTLRARARTEEVACIALRIVIERYSDFLESVEHNREEKALAQLRWQIRKAKKANLDCTELEDSLKNAEKLVRRPADRVVVIRPPHCAWGSKGQWIEGSFAR